MNRIFEEDLSNIVKSDYIPWESLKNKSILITGGTGLIGLTLVPSLIVANRYYSLNMNIYILTRDVEKAKEKFSKVLYGEKNEYESSLYYIAGSVETFLWTYGKSIDYIIHGASRTDSKGFIEQPVETIDTALIGTRNVLNHARDFNCSSMVYISSMEVYGYPQKGHRVLEKEMGSLSSLDTRNCYPISKQMCEAMCVAYQKEFAVPSKIARLTQTFGPGVTYYDQRVFAYFLRCVCERDDIILKTKGETERCYLYTQDAVSAILTILLKGDDGEAYNVANEETYSSIKQMADMLSYKYGIGVKHQIENETINGYAKTLYMKLSTERIRELGWKPTGGSLCRMYERMIEYYKETK